MRRTESTGIVSWVLLVLGALAVGALLLTAAPSGASALPSDHAPTPALASGTLTPALSQREREFLPLPLGEGRGEGVPALGTQHPALRTQDQDRERPIRYSRTKLALGVVAAFWSWAVLAGILLTGLSARLRDLGRQLLRGRPGVPAVYVLLFGLLTWLLALPLDFYGGFAVEHQFGLSTQTAAGWLMDRLKGLALGLAVGVPMAIALYRVIRRAPRRWWLGVAALLILLSVVLATLYPVAVAPLFNSYRPVEDRALAERIEALAGGAGVAISDVVVEDTSRRTVKANAYFAGIGPTRRIVLTDTLLDQFTPDEVVAVVAHELGHQVHQDIWRSIAVGSIFYLVGTYLVYRLLGPILARFRRTLGFDRVEDVAGLPLLALLFSLLSFAALPALNGYSRYVEHQADRFSLEVTRNPRAFISAMEKLGQVNLSDPDPPKLLEVLFYTHPSIQERIEFARRWDEGTG